MSRFVQPSRFQTGKHAPEFYYASSYQRVCEQNSVKVGGEKERNVLFNDALNTFYLQLYGVRHMVKDHSYSEKGNPLLPHRLLLSSNSKGSFICTIPHRITHTTAFVTCRGALAGTRNSSMGSPHEGSIRRPIAPWANALPLSYVPSVKVDA